MKLLSSLVAALGLVGSGLAAPAPAHGLVARVDAAALARQRIDGLAASLADADMGPSLRRQLAQYATAALERLQSIDHAFTVTPVFAIDADLATEVDGDVVVIGAGQRVRAIVWNPSTHSFYLDPTSELGARLPVAILLVSLWLLFTCLYLSGHDTDDTAAEHRGDSAETAFRKAGSRGHVAVGRGLDEKSAMYLDDGADGLL